MIFQRLTYFYRNPHEQGILGYLFSANDERCMKKYVGGGGVKMPKNSMTSFMNGPLLSFIGNNNLQYYCITYAIYIYNLSYTGLDM